MGCFNFDDPDHMARECRHPKNFAKAAARKLEYFDKKKTPNSVHVVLAYLCQQLDQDKSEYGSDTGEPSNDADIFQNIVEESTYSNTAGDNDDNHEVDIFAVNIDIPTNDRDEFLVAFIDSGAQRTVIGKRQPDKYDSLTKNGHVKRTHQCTTRFKFGNTTYDGLGKLNVRIPIVDDYFIDVEASILDVDVPLLIGLDVLKRLKVILDFSEFTMSSTSEDWTVPLARKLGHAYIEWTDNILYTENELMKIHRHFYHPSTDKLYAIIKLAEPLTTNTGIYETLDKIRNSCDV